MADNVTTPVFRASYPHLLKPQKNDLNGEMEYQVVALFRKGEDLSKLKAAAEAAVVAKWGADKKKWPDKLKSPFRDQAERAKKDPETGKRVLPQGYEEGAIFLTLKSKQRPGLVDQNVQDIIDDTVFYAGCWARATVRAFAYDQKGNTGVSFGLQNVQKYADGDSLSGRTKAQDDFAPVEATSAGAEASASSVFD